MGSEEKRLLLPAEEKLSDAQADTERDVDLPRIRSLFAGESGLEKYYLKHFHSSADSIYEGLRRIAEALPRHDHFIALLLLISQENPSPSRRVWVNLNQLSESELRAWADDACIALGVGDKRPLHLWRWFLSTVLVLGAVLIVACVLSAVLWRGAQLWVGIATCIACVTYLVFLVVLWAKYSRRRSFDRVLKVSVVVSILVGVGHLVVSCCLPDDRVLDAVVQIIPQVVAFEYELVDRLLFFIGSACVGVSLALSVFFVICKGAKVGWIAFAVAVLSFVGGLSVAIVLFANEFDFAGILIPLLSFDFCVLSLCLVVVRTADGDFVASPDQTPLEAELAHRTPTVPVVGAPVIVPVDNEVVIEMITHNSGEAPQ